MPSRSLAQTLLIVIAMTLGIALFLILITGSVRTYNIPTASMEPTIPVGSRLIVVRSHRANRGDIVVFSYPMQPDVTMIKRVVAVEGDTIEIRAKELFVNGKKVTEPYVIHTDETTYPANVSLPEPYRSRDHIAPFVVPAGKLYVLGDNRDESADSRYWGPIDRASVKGRPVLLINWKRGVRRI